MAPLNNITGISPRTNFDTIWSSFTTVFILLIGDSWETIMLDYIRVFKV